MNLMSFTLVALLVSLANMAYVVYKEPKVYSLDHVFVGTLAAIAVGLFLAELFEIGVVLLIAGSIFTHRYVFPRHKVVDS